MLRSHGLAKRLFLMLFAVMAVGFGVFAYLSAEFHSRNLIRELTRAGNQSADLLVRAADFAMLQNHREVLTEMIRAVGREPGIEAVRIYNKDGMIVLSGDPSEKGSVVDMQAEACHVCHSGPNAPQSAPVSEMSRIVSRNGSRSLGVIRPIYNRPDCSGPPCHAHTLDRSVLGLLEVRLTMADVDLAMAEEQRTNLLMGAVMILLVAGAAGVFVHGLVHRPILDFTRATREVAAGNLEVRLPEQGAVELAALAEDFNRMAEALTRARAENEQWSETLERRVASKTRELERLHQRMRQVEKMASLGQLAATVAHELNNPLSGILTYAKLLLRRARSDDRPEPEELRFIADETQRCGEIVNNLLLFARQGIGEVAPHDLEKVIEDGLKLVAHKVALNAVRLHRQLSPVSIVCDGDQIRQAIMALLINAVEAMPDGGELRVRVEAEEEGAMVEISDTGVGIPAADRPHIFEPFYSSKHDGKGVGLGLSLVYGIVARHGGTIDVESETGQGATFTIHLPPTPRKPAKREEQTHA